MPLERSLMCHIILLALNKPAGWCPLFRSLEGYDMSDEEAQLQAAIALSLQSAAPGDPHDSSSLKDKESSAEKLESDVKQAKSKNAKGRAIKRGKKRAAGMWDATPSELDSCFALLDPSGRGSVDVHGLIMVRLCTFVTPDASLDAP